MVMNMSKIDTISWGSFKVSDIFETFVNGGKLQVPTGATVEKKDLKEGKVPRITVTAYNNGIFGYYDCNISNKNYRVYNNFISVSFLGTVFYQPNNASLDMKVHCLKPLNTSLTERTGKFLVSVIRNSIMNSTYADQLSSTVLPNLEIKLPLDLSGQLNWLYMEKYIENLDVTINDSITKFDSVNNAKKEKMDITLWKKFPISNLFKVVKGSRLTKADMKEGSIRYIGASSFSNGITQYIANTEHIHPGNVLTVCYNGSDIGRTFYQDEQFWATDDVNVLYPKFELTKEIALFLAPIIKAVGGSHEYDDKWKKEDMEKDELCLPVDKTGNPDWIYMTNYMKSVQMEVCNAINQLQVIV
jgi:hypothetical protein